MAIAATALAFALAVSPFAPGTAGEDVASLPSAGTIELDRTHWADVGAEQLAVRVTLEVEFQGPHTLTAQSHDFDARLTLYDGEHNTLASDDDGGYETNPRIALDLAPGRYTLVVSSVDGAGQASILVVARHALPMGHAERLRAGAVFCETALARALDRKDEVGAGRHGLRLGDLLFQRSDYEHARRVLLEAVPRLRAGGDELAAAQAIEHLGRSAHATSDFAEAQARFEDALGSYRGLGDRSHEISALLNLGRVFRTIGDQRQAADLFARGRGWAEELDDTALRARALAELGNLDAERGRLVSAKALLEERLRLVETLADPKARANAIGDLGLVQAQLGDTDGGLERLQQQLAIARELDDPATECKALGNLGYVYAKRGETALAREHHDDALSVARKVKSPLSEAEALRNLAAFRYDVGDYRGASRLYREQLEIVEQLAMPGAAGRARLSIGDCLLNLDSGLEARAMIERAIDACQRSGNVIVEADAHLVLARLLRGAGDIEAALEHGERARVIYERLDRSNLPFLHQYAFACFELGHHDRARNAFEQLRRDANARNETWFRLSVFEGFALLADVAGRHAEALDLQRRRFELAQDTAIFPVEAAAQRGMGAQLIAVGALEPAIAPLQSAIEAQVRIQNPMELLESRLTLARALAGLGRFEEAHAEAAQSIEIARQSGHAAATAAALSVQGYVDLLEGNADRALPVLEQAFELATEAGYDFLQPIVRGYLARAAFATGDVDRARDLADRVLATFDQHPLAAPSETLTARWTAVSCAIAGGRVEAARTHLEAAHDLLYARRVEAARAARDGFGLGQDSTYWLPQFGRLEQDFTWAVSSGATHARSERHALLDGGFQRADAGRARMLLAGIVEHARGARSALAMEQDQERMEILDRWIATRERRREAIRDGAPASESERLKKEAERLRQRADQIERALARSSPRDAAFDAHYGVGSDLARAGTLSKSTVLIQYAEGSEHLYAYVLSAQDLTLHRLGERAVLARAADTFVGQIGDRARRAGPDAIAAKGGALYDRLLRGPLKAAGGAVKQLVIVPTPSLAALPFDCLVVDAPPEPGGFSDLTFVLDRYATSYGPSSSVLVHLAERGLRKRAGRALVLADPVYPGERPQAATTKRIRPALAETGARAMPTPGELLRLPATRFEAFTLARALIGDEESAAADLAALHRERSGTVRGDDVDVHLGAAASRDRLEEDLRDYSWIHLAVHGYVDREAQGKPGIALAGEGDLYGGFFSVLDAARLDLDADLVVLSACDSASGRVRQGEGVESMASAFLYAGARNVVASLWQIDDGTTADTMAAFYDALADDDMPATALRRAKLAVRAGGPTRGHRLGAAPEPDGAGHPYSWGAFIHIGLPR